MLSDQESAYSPPSERNHRFIVKEHKTAESFGRSTSITVPHRTLVPDMAGFRHLSIHLSLGSQATNAVYI